MNWLKPWILTWVLFQVILKSRKKERLSLGMPGVILWVYSSLVSQEGFPHLNMRKPKKEGRSTLNTLRIFPFLNPRVSVSLLDGPTRNQYYGASNEVALKSHFFYF